MVPYVRISFYKHFKEGMKVIEGMELSKDYVETLPIDSDKYTKYEKVYEYAMEQTIKETYQAVEGMYHNLEIWA